MDLSNQDIQALFNFSATVISKKEENFERQKRSSLNLETDVPDVLDEFSDVIDTSIFRQPFSLRKYKNLIPKPPKKHSRKKNRKQSIEISKFGLYSDCPCSPSLSVDSAVDLSADQYNTPIDELYSPICIGRFPDSDHFDVTDFEYSKINKAKPNKRTGPQRLDIADIDYKKKKDENIIVVPMPSFCKVMDNPKSIFDILLSNLSYPIPIHVEKSNDEKYTARDKKHNFTQLLNQNFKPSESLSDLSLEEDYKTNKEESINSEKFTETIVDLMCDTDQDIDGDVDKMSNMDLSEVFGEGQKSDIIVLPENIAVRTAQFVVEENEVPLNLLDVLGSEDCENELLPASDQQNSSAYNFHTSLLNLFSSGIQKHNIDTNNKTTKNRLKRQKKSKLICAQNVKKKYQVMRDKQRNNAS